MKKTPLLFISLTFLNQNLVLGSELPAVAPLPLFKFHGSQSEDDPHTTKTIDQKAPHRFSKLQSRANSPESRPEEKGSALNTPREYRELFYMSLQSFPPTMFPEEEAPSDSHQKVREERNEGSKRLSFSDLFFLHENADNAHLKGDHIQSLYAEIPTPQQGATPSMLDTGHPGFQDANTKRLKKQTLPAASQEPTSERKGKTDPKKIERVLKRINSLTKQEKKEVAKQLSHFTDITSLEDTLTPQQHRAIQKKEKGKWCCCCSKSSRKALVHFALELISSDPVEPKEERINKTELAEIVKAAIARKKACELRKRGHHSHEPIH